MAGRDEQTTLEREFLEAAQAQDWARAVEHVERHWTRLLFSTATAPAVFATLREAPEDVLHRSTKVRLHAEVIGRLPVGSTPVTMPGNAARVEAALRDGTARDLVETAILAMISFRANAHPREAVAVASGSRPLVLASATTPFSPASDLAAYWHLQAGQAALHAGDADQAAADLTRAWAFGDTDLTGYVRPSSAPYLALLAELSGDGAEAARWQQEVDRLAPAGRELIEWDTMERPRLVARLLAAADRLDLEEGERLTELLVARLPFDEIWPVTLFAATRHLVNAAATDRAARLMDTALGLHPGAAAPGSLPDAFVTLARADLALGAGRATALAGILDGTSPDDAPDLRTPYAVHLELLAGDLAAARRRAVIGEQALARPRVARECALARIVIDLEAGDGQAPPTSPVAYGPHLRRTASLLPDPLNQRLRRHLGDDVPPTQEALRRAGPAARLTPAESRVLRTLAEAGPLAEVAERLYVSRNTLKTHLRSLYAKLGVSSREEAVALGRHEGLLGDAGDPAP